MPLADGQSFAGYTILRHLGSGGMGEVYLAQHPRLPRNDAVKVLPTAFTDDREYSERFNREADIAATLWHPHIVGVHDRGEFEGQLWISMDYVEGTDAAYLLEDSYPNGMPPDEAVRIIKAVAEALDYAHQRQLLHRDVKPANILLSHPESGHERILLADFGIARRVDDASGLTGTNMTVGTVAYAAPEQLMGEQLDGRADQYALAATAFHLLTGTPPFEASNPAVVISQHLSAPPPSIGTRRPALSDLGPVFSKALAKVPADRYDTCMDFTNALEESIGTVAAETGATEDTISARAARRPKHGLRPRRAEGGRPKPKPAVVIAVVLALLLIGVSAIALLLFGREREMTASPEKSVPSAASSSPFGPPVILGADCASPGLAGTAPGGKQAFCKKIVKTGDYAWSLYDADLSPSATPGATDNEYPAGIEEQVEVCVEQTKQTRDKCLKDVNAGNIVGPTFETSPRPT